MVWVPLPHMREKFVLKEQLEIDATSLEYFLRREHGDEILTSANYIYKEPGLAVLRTQDDEDDEGYLTPIQLPAQQPPNEFEPTSLVMTALSVGEPALVLQSNSLLPASDATTPSADMATLLNIKKRQIEEAFHKGLASTEQTRPLAASSGVWATDIISQALIPSKKVPREFMSEYTDSTPLVNNFLEMDFSKKPKLAHSYYFDQPGTTKSTSQSKADEAAMLMALPHKPVPGLVPSFNLSKTFPPHRRVLPDLPYSNTAAEASNSGNRADSQKSRQMPNSSLHSRRGVAKLGRSGHRCLLYHRHPPDNDGPAPTAGSPWSPAENVFKDSNNVSGSNNSSNNNQLLLRPRKRRHEPRTGCGARFGGQQV